MEPTATEASSIRPEWLGRCRSMLESHYGSQLGGLVLYGSTARGEAGPESDVDLLVLLREPFDYFRELRVLTSVLYPLQLEVDRLISALPTSVEEFEQGRLQLYRNAAEEGMRL